MNIFMSAIKGGNRLTHYRHSYIYIYMYTRIYLYTYICLAGSNRSNTSGSGIQSLDRLMGSQRPKLRAGVHFVTALDQSCRDVEVCSSARRAPSTSLGDNSSSPKQSAGYGPQVGVDSGGDANLMQITRLLSGRQQAHPYSSQHP